MFRRHSVSDTQRYRMGYPGKSDHPKLKKNLQFYSNQISSVPNGDTIENIHRLWRFNYSRLEVHHGYIQWLFPIREDGLNFQAQELQLHEANAIKSNPTLQGRILESYSLMLDFYGFILVDRNTGSVARSPDYRARFRNLVNHPHNFLRITRILKCLGEMGLEHVKYAWLHALISEAVSKDFLLVETADSLSGYWIETVKDDTIRQQMSQYLADCISFATRSRRAAQSRGKVSSDAEPLTPPLLPSYCGRWETPTEQEVAAEVSKYSDGYGGGRNPPCEQKEPRSSVVLKERKKKPDVVDVDVDDDLPATVFDVRDSVEQQHGLPFTNLTFYVPKKLNGKSTKTTATLHQKAAAGGGDVLMEPKEVLTHLVELFFLLDDDDLAAAADVTSRVGVKSPRNEAIGRSPGGLEEEDPRGGGKRRIESSDEKQHHTPGGSASVEEQGPYAVPQAPESKGSADEPQSKRGQPQGRHQAVASVVFLAPLDVDLSEVRAFHILVAGLVNKEVSKRMQAASGRDSTNDGSESERHNAAQEGQVGKTTPTPTTSDEPSVFVTPQVLSSLLSWCYSDWVSLSLKKGSAIDVKPFHIDPMFVDDDDE